MNRKEVLKFLMLTKDQAFAIHLRHGIVEHDYIEISEETELLEESILYTETTIEEDKSETKYYSLINIADIVYMSSNY